MCVIIFGSKDVEPVETSHAGACHGGNVCDQWLQDGEIHSFD